MFQKLFDPENPLMQFLIKAGNIVILNMLWLLCCIPIVTIGASTAAMYTVARDYVREPTCNVVVPFFNYLVKGFLKSTALTALALVISALFVVNALMSRDLPFILSLISFIPVGLCILSFTFVFPLFAQFENSVFKTLKNALFLSITNFFRALLSAFLLFFPGIILFFSEYFFLQLSVLWVMFGCALTAVAITKIYQPVFRKYAEIPEGLPTGFGIPAKKDDAAESSTDDATEGDTHGIDENSTNDTAEQ